MEDIDGGLHPAVDGQSLDEMRYVATKYCPFRKKFAICVHGNEQRIAFSVFEYIRTLCFALVMTTFRVAFVSTAVSPLKTPATTAADLGSILANLFFFFFS